MHDDGQFAAAVAGPPEAVRLDRAWALVTEQAHPASRADDLLARLDDLAAGCRVPTLDGLRHHLFVDQGFTGNRADYYDPANSLLDEVLDRHLGIPISLSVLTMEVGRRLGVPVDGIGLPGHFVLRDGLDGDVYLDPFAGGRLLDREGCVDIVQRLHGAGTSLDPRWLEPLPPRMILTRMLANLVHTYEQRQAAADLLWARALQADLAAAEGDRRASLRLRAAHN